MSKTLILTIIIFLMASLGSEYALRRPTLQAQLPLAELGTGYDPFEQRRLALDEIVRNGQPVDCILLGSSLLHNALDPFVFAAAYQEQTGESLTCYNFGLSALSGSTAAPVAQYLVNTYHPRLLVFGTAPRDFNAIQTQHLVVEDTFPQSDWAQYQAGSMNVLGWLFDHVYTYRYLNTIPRAMEGTALHPDSPLVQGFYPRFFFNHSSPIFPMLDQQELVAAFTQAPYEFSDEDFAGFQQLVRLGEDGSVNLIVVEIPTFYSEAMPAFTSEFAEDKERDFEGIVLPYAHEHNVPAWRFDDDQWRAHAEFYADPDHLYLSASHIFSEWLGQQIGQASQQGLFQTPVLQSLLTGAPQPILPTMIPSLATQGFSEQAYTTYEAYLQQFDLFPLDARIFTPDSDIFDLDTLRTSLGIYLEWAYPDDLQGEQDFLALIAAFERMTEVSELELSASQQEQFNMWRETKLPQHLRDMGFDYIIYSNFWSGWLSEAEWALLNNPDYYQEVARWDHPVMFTATYHLYRIMGD